MSQTNKIKKVSEMYDDSILSAIGSLMLSASVSEVVLTLLYMRILSHPEPMEPNLLYPIQGMEFRSKLHLINQQCEFKIKSHKSDIAKQCKKIERAFVKRNLFAHGVINESYQGDTIAITFIKDLTYGKESKLQIVKADDIHAYAQEVRSRVYGLGDLLTEAGIRDF